MLTQQYEFAKVQEAKETPSVKVLDTANIPEKKSYPPRLFITLSGAGLGLGLAVAWLWSATAWREADSRHPAKAFLNEVYAGLKSDLRLDPGVRSPRNGNSAAGNRPFG